jgi:hypothetical protein
MWKSAYFASMKPSSNPSPTKKGDERGYRSISAMYACNIVKCRVKIS